MAFSAVNPRALRDARSRGADITAGGLRTTVYRLLCVFVFTLPGEGVIRIGGQATIAKAVGLIVAGVAAMSILKSGRWIRLNDSVLLTFVFAAWVAVSTFWSVTPDESRHRVITMAQLVIMVLIMWEFAHTRRRVMGLLSAWVAGCVVIGAIIVFAWALGVSQNRYTAPGTHPGDQAYSLLLAIPMAWYLAMRTLRPGLMVAYRLFIPFACFAVVLTASRAALLSMGIALLIIPLTITRISPRARAAVGAAVLAGAVAAGQLATSASGPIQRLSTTSSEITNGTLDHRTELWSIGLRLVAQHPILGVGTGGSKVAVGAEFPTDKGLHDTFLSIAAELGLVGLALFLLICLAASYRALTRLPWLELRMAQVLTAVFVIALVPRQDDYGKSTWAILTLLALMGSVFPARMERSRDQPREVLDRESDDVAHASVRDRLTSASG
jgi:putative inorganic carbon (HCO3(-)) transporter